MTLIAVSVGLTGGVASAAATITPGGSPGWRFPKATIAASDVSSNWAGYAVTAPLTTYTSVTGTWKQPEVTCTVGDAGSSSAFWIGLGGYSANSQALEQIGTSAHCDQAGQATYYAWYELVPAASVTIKLKINPGDMANFGSVSFSKIAAIGNGLGGTLTNPTWTAATIQLVSGGGRGFFPGRDRLSGAIRSNRGRDTSSDVNRRQNLQRVLARERDKRLTRVCFARSGAQSQIRAFRTKTATKVAYLCMEHALGMVVEIFIDLPTQTRSRTRLRSEAYFAGSDAA